MKEWLIDWFCLKILDYLGRGFPWQYPNTLGSFTGGGKTWAWACGHRKWHTAQNLSYLSSSPTIKIWAHPGVGVAALDTWPHTLMIKDTQKIQRCFTDLKKQIPLLFVQLVAFRIITEVWWTNGPLYSIIIRAEVKAELIQLRGSRAGDSCYPSCECAKNSI